MTNASCCPVVDKFGRHHPSQIAAAAALGVSVKTVCYHLNKNGDLSRVGVGRGNHHGHTSSQAEPVVMGDREWPSRTLFARHLGVNAKTVQGWFRRGDTDRILSALMHADTLRSGAQQ